MPDGDVIVGTLYAGVAGLWGYIAAVALFSMVTPTSAKIGKNRTLGWTAAMETHMKARRPEQARELEELPNIGRAIAADLRAVGIMEPRQLAELAPLSVYLCLGAVMGKRQDPCVLYPAGGQAFSRQRRSPPLVAVHGRGAPPAARC